MTPIASSLRHVFVALLGVAVLAPGLPAQTGGEKRAQAMVTFMSWERPAEGLYTTLDEKEFQPVQAPAYEFGDPSTVPAGTSLRIFQRTEREGRRVYEVVAEAALPEQCTQAQVYLIRQKDNGDLHSYRLVVMPGDPGHFKAGEVRVFNFSQYPAMVRVNDSSFSLEPLEWKKVAAVTDRKYRLPVFTALQVGGSWTGVGRALMSLRPQYRGNAVIVHTLASFDGSPALAADQEPRLLTLTSTEYVNGPEKLR